MKNITKYLIIVAGIVLGFACVKEPTMSATEIEQRSLKAWIEKYHPELLENYQEEGGYYVEILDRGVQDSLPITGKDAWLWVDFTARDLQGNVCETRSWELALQQNTYNNHTHYTPVFRFSGKDSHTLLEGSYLAIFNKLKIGDEEFEARYGTRLRLYLPSTVTSSNTGGTADGGYEGQYELDGDKPAIVDMMVYGHITNPVAYEGNRVDSFANINGGLCTEHKAEPKEDAESAEKSMRRRLTRADSEEGEEEIDTRPLEFYDGRWHQPIDTLAQLYVNYAYSPARNTFDYNAIGVDTLMYPSENSYDKGKIYGTSTLADIDRRINEALVERFGEGITYDEVLEADSLKTKATANVWYIGRFLDGYVFDTNIDEVREIVFGDVGEAGEALSFETKKPLENDYILAWNYALPTLRRGQWATILTVSTYAYGISGQVGAHTSTTTGDTSAIDYANYYNYMSYMNSMYGYGYGSMYNSGYYGYNPYYYGYNYVPSNTNTTTITTTATEIPSYSPMIFQVFVEK